MKIKYVTGTSTSSYTLNDNIADSIWLFSEREVYGQATYSGTTAEGVGTTGDGYAKYTNPKSKYYQAFASDVSSSRRQAYKEDGFTNHWMLRSPSLSNYSNLVRYVVYSGGIGDYSTGSTTAGVSFGFCIR